MLSRGESGQKLTHFSILKYELRETTSAITNRMT